METDITLKDSIQTIIVDTKFTDKIFKPSRYEGGTKKLRTEHLYQIFSYITNQKVAEPTNRDCKGLLLYPTITETVDETYVLNGHELRVRSLNLNQEWQKIHIELLDIFNIKNSNLAAA